MIDADKVALRDTPSGTVIAVKVVPGSSRDRVVGVLGDSLKIATAAAPEKGKANAAVAQILAKALGTEKRNVQLVSGPANPRKEFCIGGMSVADVRRILSAANA